MQTDHPNATAMHAAVSRWIEEASGRPNEAALLWRKVEWLEAQSAILSGPTKTPKHLEGLSAWDFVAAIGKLVGAATTAERSTERRAAA